jgi:hypothetical protein
MQSRFNARFMRNSAVVLLVLLALLGRPVHALYDAFAEEEAFEIAIAKCHARTHLDSFENASFHIFAEGQSHLAFRATGKFSFEED